MTLVYFFGYIPISLFSVSSLQCFWVFVFHISSITSEGCFTLGSHSCVFLFCFHPVSVPLLLSLSRHLFQSQGKTILPLAPDPSGRTKPRQRCSSSFAVSFSRRAEPCSRGALSQREFPPRQWAAYQGKQQPPPCQPATKPQTAKGEEELQI